MRGGIPAFGRRPSEIGGAWKRVACGVALVAALAVPLDATSFPWDEQQQQLEQLETLIGASKKQLQQVQTQIATVRAAIGQLDRQLEALQRDLTQQKARLDELEAQIQRKTAELHLKERELARHQQQLEQRTRSLYKGGGHLTIASLAFSATSFSDMLNGLFYVQDVVQADRRLVNRVRMDKAAIEVARTEIQQKRDLQAQVVAQMQEKLAEVEAVRAQRAAALQSLRRAESKMQEYLADQEAARARVAEEIKRLKAAFASGAFMWPLFGTITQGFGCTSYPFEPRDSRCPGGHFHSGIDIAAPHGTRVMAADSGRAYVKSTAGGYGLHVIIGHQQGNTVLFTLYGHLSRFAISDGVVVGKGQVIGYEGSTGNSTGPHVHFELFLPHPDGSIQYLDPLAYLPPL